MGWLQRQQGAKGKGTGRFMDPEDLRRVAEFVNSQRPLGEELPDTNAVKSPISASKPVVFQTRADYSESMKILKEHGLRPLTYQEALVAIDKDPELKKQLKGEWFYLDGKGSQLPGHHTFNDKGELTPGKGDIERTVHVLKGSQPLSLGVLWNPEASRYGRRFGLGAIGDPSDVATVVLGTSDTPPANR